MLSNADKKKIQALVKRQRLAKKAVKSLKDGITRQANWHKGNQVGLISANFLPEEQTLDQLSGGKTLAELLETAI